MKKLKDKLNSVRNYTSKFDSLLNRMPALGKVLSSIFGQLELLILESVRILERKFKIQIYFSLTSKILKRRWG